MNAKNTIPAVEKSVKLLHLLAASDEAMTCAQLANQLSISQSTCYRIIQSLVAHDWLRPTVAGSFTFSAGIFPLLKPLSNYQKLFESLGAPLSNLVVATGLMAKISVKQGDSAVTVHRVESPRPLSPSFKVGGTFSLAYGSSGACLMADLEDEEISRILDECSADVWSHQTPDDVWQRIEKVRSEGVSQDPGMYQPSVYGISAPVHNRTHRCFAAISLIGWADDFSPDRVEVNQTKLITCAKECTASLADKAVA